MAAGNVRRRCRTQGHPKDVGPFEPADQEAAPSRPRRPSGNPPSGLIIPAPDETPGRVSWPDPGGRLMHRPFDGAFPAEFAMWRCQEVFLWWLEQPDGSARDRAYVMALTVEAGLPSFGYDESHQLSEALPKAGLV